MRIYHQSLFAGFPSELGIDRLILRRLMDDDAGALHRTVGDPEVMKHWHPGPDPSVAATRERVAAINAHWDTYGFGDWGIVRKTDGELVGFCGLHFIDRMAEVNLGYALQRSCWRMGFGYEACSAVLNGVRWTFPEIVAVIAPQNTVSRRLAEKLGLQPWHETVWSSQPRVVYRLTS